MTLPTREVLSLLAALARGSCGKHLAAEATPLLVTLAELAHRPWNRLEVAGQLGLPSVDAEPSFPPVLRPWRRRRQRPGRTTPRPADARGLACPS